MSALKFSLYRVALAAVVSVSVLLLATPASAKAFRFAFQADALSLDPHSLNETFTLSLLGNVYEGLTHYDGDLQVKPALATSWENLSPTKLRFKLRRGVVFHNGNPFTADDVIFSWRRMLGEGSDQKARAALIGDIVKIDDHTIEVSTPQPTPTLTQEMVYMYVMDKEWAEANNSVNPASPKDAGRDNAYATTNENGTGPFTVVSRQPDVKTVMRRFDRYWGDVPGNVDEVEFTPIAQAATRVAALLSGQIDLAYPVPVQDWNRLDSADGVRALTGPEARTIFLGMDQFRDELLYSDVRGDNPLKDARVRQAFAHAINLGAIKATIMRGASTPSGVMWAPQISGYNAAANIPYRYDLAAAKRLLADAGYADGFELGMDCPNNRYVNDEKICQAVASMLAKIGVRINLLAQPKSKYFAKVLAQGGYDTSFYLLGWTPGSIDVHNVFLNLIACQNADAKRGQFNIGNYCNAEVDRLTDRIGEETDVAKRRALIDAATRIVRDEFAYLPIHQQPLSWGVREGVSVVQRADNVLDFRSVAVK
ncbi:MAG: ABC transporter substrate-binding protein [bacterium]